jgi:TonB family protein
MMDVTDILRDRMQESTGLSRMLTLSAALHVGLITALALAPKGLWTHAADSPRHVMTITLGGGGSGPQNGGMTSLGGRPVQVRIPPEEAPKREAVRPPAAKTPEMTLPKPGAKPLKATPVVPVRQAPDEARGRTPTHGNEVSSGSAVAETGARGQGFGLSTGGGPGSGSMLDVSDFCCPEYVALMLERIRSSWDQRAETSGAVIVRFTIERDGRITATTVEKPSGYAPLDISAQRAVLVTRQLPPLPSAFPNPSLTVHLNFQYQR